MNKIKRLFSLFFSVVFLASILSSTSFAGNNDSIPSYGYSGKGDDNWKYNSNYSGMRISIYWAPDEASFKSGDNVIQIGNTTDVSKTGPWYHVDEYTLLSVFWYMNNGKGGERKFKSTLSYQRNYDWAGYGDGPDIQRIVNKMPDVWTGTKAQWDNWFEGPIDSVTHEKGYENIPDIARLCGADISVEQFKSGELDIFGYKRTGVYKIFFEPVIYPIVDGVCMAMTLRDLIRWEEAFHRNDIATSDGKDLIEWITPVFVFTSNSQFLIENEAAISMYGKNSADYTKAYSDTKFPLFQSNISKVNSFKAIYDSTDINVRRAQRAVIKEQLNPEGGIIYSSMGVGVVTPYTSAEEPEPEPVIESEYEEPVDHTVINENAFIKADPRDNEAFDVTKGIPSGEAVYTQIISDSYLYRLKTNTVSGSVTTRVTVNHLDEEGEPKTTEVNVSRSYSYIEITSFELYGIKNATVENDALPGKRVALTPRGGYSTPSYEVIHDPNDRYSYHVSRSSDKTIESDAVTEEEVFAAAQAVVWSPTVKNDKLIINGKVILDPQGGLSTSHTPDKINRDVLYASDLVIPEATNNGTYESSGTISYERVYSHNPENPQTLTFNLENINPIVVHTPVCVDMSISSDDIHNQKVNPSNSASALILGRPFTVNITNSGTHRSIKGYGSRDYTKYIKDREIRFTFDAYLGTDMTGAYLKANTWYSLRSLGVSVSTSLLTFYTPVWVDEGLYNVEVRSIAKNDTTKKTESRANLNPANTAALANGAVEVSGRVYDFTITDIDDISWEPFFRKAANSHEHTGKVFYTGPRNINGNPDSTRKYALPVMPGKNDVKGYQQRAVKLGYTVKFEIKTVGNYYDELDYVQIKPTFAFVDSNGKNRQEVDLYYSTAQNPLIKIGSPEDTEIQKIRLDFKYRGIDLSEFTNTAQTIFRLRGGMGTYTLDKWKEAFPKLSQNGVTISKYSKLLLSEPIRSFRGPDKSVPENVNKDKAFASMQKWYGEYHLPADLLVVPKGTDLSKERNLTRNSPVFLKDGYVIVNFKDITIINNDDFDHPNLAYTGKTGDGWTLEGYSLNQGGWQLLTGDIIAYYADKRASDDYIGTGTH